MGERLEPVLLHAAMHHSNQRSRDPAPDRVGNPASLKVPADVVQTESKNKVRRYKDWRARNHHRARGDPADVACNIGGAVARADDANALSGKRLRFAVVGGMQIFAAEFLGELGDM